MNLITLDAIPSRDKMPILEQISPIRRYPTNLAPRQILWLDGLRFSIETAELAYARLRKTTDQLTTAKASDTEPLVIAVVADAWGFIDSIDRFRSLIRVPPHFGKTKPAEIEAFLTRTQPVRELRNRAQHLPPRIPQSVARREPLWGTISWVTWQTDGAEAECYSCVLNAGTPIVHEGSRLDFPGVLPESVDAAPILIRAEGVDVRLDLVLGELRTIVEWLEQFLSHFFDSEQAAATRTAPDLLFVGTLDMQVLRDLLGTDGDPENRNGV